MNIRLLLRKIMYYILNTPKINNNVVLTGYSRGIQNVLFEGKNAVPDRCNFSGNISLGYATTLGYNNFLHGNISIGKYCQLGADIAIHTTNHPTNYMTTYINKNLFKGELKKLKETNTVVIGNDVWIGHNALIVGNVKIGNGAVIAAGAIVTKNVSPYTIVAGVPAKPIRKRFSDAIINEVEALKWWDMSEVELEKIKPMFFKDFNNNTSIYK